MGFVTAFVETTQGVLLRPSEFFKAMPVTGGIGGPLLYAVIVGYLGLVASTLYGAVFSSIFGATFGRFGGQRAEFERMFHFLAGWGGVLVQLVTGPVSIVIGAFVIAGILHVLLMVVGAAPRDFEATFRVVAYSFAVSVLDLLPFCGRPIGFVWWVAVVTLGFVAVHRTSVPQALGAVLLPILLCCCCAAIGVALAAGGVATAIRQFQ